jgi:transposase-like protein
MSSTFPPHNAPQAIVSPDVCPSCKSTAITTTSKNPDGDSYWRCTQCGDVWNHTRRTATTRSFNSNSYWQK